VIIHAYGKLEAGLHTGGTVNAFKGVIVELLTFGINGEGISGANPGAIPTEVTLFGVKV
jgi:hypothetical protein